MKSEPLTRSFMRNYSPYKGTKGIRRESNKCVKGRPDGFTLAGVFLSWASKVNLVGLFMKAIGWGHHSFIRNDVLLSGK